MNIKPMSQSFFKRNAGKFILLVLAVVFLTIFTINQQEKAKKETMLTGIVECPPLAQGKQMYNVLVGSENDPQIMQVAFDPLDVEVGGTQTVTLKVLNHNAADITQANKAQVTYYTDNKPTTISLLMKRVDNASGSVEVDPNGSDLLTTWEGTWMNDDTHCTTYMAEIIAANANGENKVDVSFR